MGTQHLTKCSQSCLLNWCCALQTIRDRWHPHKPTRRGEWPSSLIRTSQPSLVVRGCCPPQPRREMGAGGMGNRITRRKKPGTTDVPPGQRHSVPAPSRVQTWFVCIQWNCFCVQRGFQLLWGRWKALLAALKCLVLPAFGSMHGARTKYTTVQCKLSGKKINSGQRYLNYRKTRSRWLTLPLCLLLSLSRNRAAHTADRGPGQLKERWGGSECQRAATTTRNFIWLSLNLELESRAECAGSSYKRGAFTFGRAPLTCSRWQQLFSLGWGKAPPASVYSSPSLCSPFPQKLNCFCMPFRVAQKQVRQKAALLSESLRHSLLDQLVHPTRVIASLKYLVC